VAAVETVVEVVPTSDGSGGSGVVVVSAFPAKISVEGSDILKVEVIILLTVGYSVMGTITPVRKGTPH
jgi:hypothetical protein